MCDLFFRSLVITMHFSARFWHSLFKLLSKNYMKMKIASFPHASSGDPVTLNQVIKQKSHHQTLCLYFIMGWSYRP